VIQSTKIAIFDYLHLTSPIQEAAEYPPKSHSVRTKVHGLHFPTHITGLNSCGEWHMAIMHFTALYKQMYTGNDFGSN